MKNGYFRSLGAEGDLGATYAFHLTLIGKPVVDFPLVLLELFC